MRRVVKNPERISEHSVRDGDFLRLRIHARDADAERNTSNLAQSVEIATCPDANQARAGCQAALQQRPTRLRDFVHPRLRQIETKHPACAIRDHQLRSLMASDASIVDPDAWRIHGVPGYDHGHYSNCHASANGSITSTRYSRPLLKPGERAVVFS
jgi:hypothetical protein